MVANVFVRVFIAQPTFQLSDAPGFTKGLVSWIYSHAAEAFAAPGVHQLACVQLPPKPRSSLLIRRQGTPHLLDGRLTGQ